MVYREFAAKKDSLNEILEFVDSELEKVSAPMKVMTQMDVSIEEIFVNIASYAYSDNANASAEIGVEASANQITVVFEDSGIPFDPLAKADPDITLSAEERGIGGLGIFMVKKFMDDVSYQRVDDKNILTILKKW